ncbi:aryl-alcohol dehydrogenase-like predicted oxidoreductase [Kribbella amoyensis]|uniref:Aryl-alcohol dehydrogenase-like predicted oxidoreductase n=1 Tax=Kribbella amoyensis TaxID=996641 RepID=A0A561AZJ8_9ACTN|nr:aldo/keto reductase [Kribbella amoyensis]TWD72045.1 aryl-alcohol dehydrogenase-like predicted oxidoreductase [Kribbella amoyensis]
MSTNAERVADRAVGDRTTSPLGIGCWAIGGPFRFDGRPAGWGEVDDAESIRMIHAAVDGGIRLFDTADVYGTGHSERVLGKALGQLPAGARDDVIVATKFALQFDETTRTGAGEDVSPPAIRSACEASLRRLGTDAIDVYQLHGGVSTGAVADEVVATLTELVAEGKVKAFGTSADVPEVMASFAQSPHAVTVQTQINVFGHQPEVLTAAHQHNFAVLARSPLAMGLLTGKYTLANRPALDDVRRDTPWWTYFDDDAMGEWLQRLDAVRDLLGTGGRTLTQGALGYVWALDPAIIPLPGARTAAQAVEHAEAVAFGPLPTAIREQIDELLADSPDRH